MDEGTTSLALNIAEGNGRYAELDRQRFFGVAESAGVKLSVYLDMGVGKGMFQEKQAGTGKEILREIQRMWKRMK